MLITENQVPATAEIVFVTWDGIDIPQKRIIVKYAGSEIPSNPEIVQLLIGLDHVGNFTYIEEKVFLDKPIFPKFPRKKNNTPKPEFDFIRVFVDCFLIIPPILYVIDYNKKKKEYVAITEYNEIVAKEQKEWDDAWSDWEKNVLSAAYLSSTNDVYGRFRQAISSLVKMTIKILFEDKKAEIRDQIEKAYSEQELKTELDKRKSEFN